MTSPTPRIDRGKSGDRGSGPASAADSPIEDGPDPGGPLVMVCLGHRCSALHALATDERCEPGLPALMSAVRSTRGAILVTTDCVGHCELAALIALGRRPASSAPVATAPGGVLPFTGGVVLAGMDRAPRADALCRWVRDGGYEIANAPEELARPYPRPS